MMSGENACISLRVNAEAFKFSNGSDWHSKSKSKDRGTMQLDNKEQQREIRYYILAYLADHPDAGDTFEGIVEWWLRIQHIAFETKNVSQVVARLVSDGLVLEQEKSDSRVMYSVNRTKEKAIRRMLNEIEASRR